jgi:hypothetical protein
MGIYGSKYTLKAQEIYKATPTTTKLLFSLSLSLSHFLPLLVVAFFAGDFTLLSFTLLTGVFLAAGAFFTTGLGAGAFFPGEVLVDVLEALAGFSFGFGFAAGFALAGAGFGFAAGLALTGAAFGFGEAALGFAAGFGFGFGFAAAFGFTCAFPLAGALVVVFTSLVFGFEGLAFGFGFGFAAGFFFSTAGAAAFEAGSLNEPFTFTSFPPATSFFKWKSKSFLKFGGSCFCFSSMNFAIAY